ncbi:hypothetical protein CRUP_000864 [Coryphaenoides rupestris]|nr:hypothetical protein CRUP_000864 [Coryphaenoides rupestris]
MRPDPVGPDQVRPDPVGPDQVRPDPVGPDPAGPDQTSLHREEGGDWVSRSSSTTEPIVEEPASSTTEPIVEEPASSTTEPIVGEPASSTTEPIVGEPASSPAGPTVEEPGRSYGAVWGGAAGAIRLLQAGGRGVYCIRLLVPARIVNISQDVLVNEGDNVNLFCLAVGRPEPTVTWKDQKFSHLRLGVACVCGGGGGGAAACC